MNPSDEIPSQAGELEQKLEFLELNGTELGLQPWQAAPLVSAFQHLHPNS
jgi:hypothetical protein